MLVVVATQAPGDKSAVCIRDPPPEGLNAQLHDWNTRNYYHMASECWINNTVRNNNTLIYSSSLCSIH